jgi:hypothetical protein
MRSGQSRGHAVGEFRRTFPSWFVCLCKRIRVFSKAALNLFRQPFEFEPFPKDVEIRWNGTQVRFGGPCGKLHRLTDDSLLLRYPSLVSSFPRVYRSVTEAQGQQRMPFRRSVAFMERLSTEFASTSTGIHLVHRVNCMAFCTFDKSTFTFTIESIFRSVICPAAVPHNKRPPLFYPFSHGIPGHAAGRLLEDGQ